jgi:molecular chaperone HscB
MKKAGAAAGSLFMFENYFTLFSLPMIFDLDNNEIESRYLQLQKQYHPDISPKHKKISEEINVAYGVLSSPVERALYLVKILYKVNIKDESATFRPDVNIIEQAYEDQELLAKLTTEEEFENYLQEKQKDLDNLCIEFGLKYLENSSVAVELALLMRYKQKLIEGIYNKLMSQI